MTVHRPWRALKERRELSWAVPTGAIKDAAKTGHLGQKNPEQRIPLGLYICTLHVFWSQVSTEPVSFAPCRPFTSEPGYFSPGHRQWQRGTDALGTTIIIPRLSYPDVQCVSLRKALDLPGDDPGRNLHFSM